MLIEFQLTQVFIGKNRSYYQKNEDGEYYNILDSLNDSITSQNTVAYLREYYPR